MNGAHWLVVLCWNWAGGENSGVGRRGKCFEGRRTAMFSSELASVLTRITHPFWILVRMQSWTTLMLHSNAHSRLTALHAPSPRSQSLRPGAVPCQGVDHPHPTQKSDGVVVRAWVVVCGVAVVVGAPPPLKGPRGGLILVRSPTPCQVSCTSVPVSVHGTPCSPCVPKGTVAPPPCPPAALHPPGRKSPGQRDRYRRYSTRTRSVSNPPPCPCHTHHHHPVTTTLAHPMQCVSTTPQRRGGSEIVPPPGRACAMPDADI